MTTEDEVVEFVQDNAKYYPHSAPQFAYMVSLNGKGIGSGDTRELVEKICRKLKIKYRKSVA